jgi:hypothetical protein
VETLASLKEENLRGHIVRGLYLKKIGTLGNFDDNYSKAMFWSFVWDPEIGSHLTEVQLLQFDQILASYCKDSLTSENEMMAPEFLFESLLADKPQLLGEKLPRTTGFLAANYPRSQEALELLSLSLMTRDFVLRGFQGVVDGNNKTETWRLLSFLAENESRLVEGETAETALRLLRAIRYSDTASGNQRHELKALRSVVERHYGEAPENIAREIAQRSYVPFELAGQMDLDRVVKAPHRPGFDPTREYEWDWTDQTLPSPRLLAGQ